MTPPAIENWCSREEIRELERLAPGRTVLEVGSYRGFSAVLMAAAGATRVWAVDWHRGDSGGDPGLGRQDTLCAWWQNVRRYGVEDQVVGLVGRSEDVLPVLRPGSFDLVLVDAAHTLEAVRRDIELTLPLLARVGGVLAFHDYSEVWPGVRQAVDELAAAHPGPYPLRVVDSLAMLEL